ncbi:MAG: RecQ family ATP-dependent DNA helicase [Fluviicola sp. XM-24bin1]|nr:MAG: RecQ family ATP-dependent DNA helicase [Fluviicola sp. XM-24bin1]
MEKSREILQKIWGYPSFRPLQEEIVDSVIYGHDTLAILPTGGGKSICFQVPGLALDGITLVISPLIALMQDQVNQLEQRGIRAALISSGLSYREIDIALDNARFGTTKFLYTSPERLKSDLFIERFKRMNVGLIVVDEAHCISEWGHDFRPSYRDIAGIREYHPNTPIIAVTASATDQVKTDIVSQLGLKQPKEFAGSLERKNVMYSLHNAENKMQRVLEHCQKHPNETGIVYCQTRRSVKEVVTQLRAYKIPAGIYHGGMSSEDRSYMLDEWMQDRLKIMVATNAFGMGIDKPDVRFVLHYELPNNLEAYYQEAGRAGRDGQPSQAIGYWNDKDLDWMKERLEAQYPTKERIKTIYNAICNYLQVAIGSGKDETYPFNLPAFSNTFEISASETYYALRILQLNETIGFTESSFFPTRLRILVGNKALYTFQVAHDSLAPLITLLTRSYPGIFDRFTTLHEGKLAKRLNISENQLRKHLERLEQYGVIDVQFQSNLPKITFLQERIADTQLTLTPSVYVQRKEREESKLQALIDFVQSDECRSKLISVYFGGEPRGCGICDNCLRQEFDSKSLHEIILAKLPNSFAQLEQEIPASRDLLQNAIRAMMHDEIIYYEEGTYFKANSLCFENYE